MDRCILAATDGEAQAIGALRCAKDIAVRAGLPLEIVVLNAGAALYAAGVADSIADGIGRAREAVASGAARAKLAGFVEATQRLAAEPA